MGGFCENGDRGVMLVRRGERERGTYLKQGGFLVEGSFSGS